MSLEQQNFELTSIYTVRKGRVFCQEFFSDHAEALETAALGA
jgi:hypothetical protein